MKSGQFIHSCKVKTAKCFSGDDIFHMPSIRNNYSTWRPYWMIISLQLNVRIIRFIIKSVLGYCSLSIVTFIDCFSYTGTTRLSGKRKHRQNTFGWKPQHLRLVAWVESLVNNAKFVVRSLGHPRLEHAHPHTHMSIVVSEIIYSTRTYYKST